MLIFALVVRFINYWKGARVSKFVTMFLAVALATAVLISTPGVIGAQASTSSQDEETTGADTGQEAVVEATFEAALLVEEVSRLANQNDVEIAEVEGEFKIGSEEFRDGYVASPGQSADEINKNYTRQRIGFLKAQIETEKSLPNGKLKQPESQTASVKKALTKRAVGPTQISKATLQGKKADLKELVNGEDEIISKASLLTEEKIRETQEADAESVNSSTITDASTAEPTFSAQAAAPSWVPDYGSTTVRKVTSRRANKPIGTPYALNRLIWYSDPGFGRYEPYEHDFFLYNYDRATLLRGGQSDYPGCFPNVYWTTSYPAAAEPYLDSRATLTPGKCEVDEKAYTVGALRADKLQADRVYQVYVSTGKTSVNRDRWKLQAGLQRRAIGCSSALCITTKEVRVLVPAWSPAPEDGLFW